MYHAQVDWQTASPLWKAAMKPGEELVRFRRPALLRFANDDFMEELQNALDREPVLMQNFIAQPETWEDEYAGWETRDDKKFPFRLFHPAQGRFYLVVASLVCKLPGLPDRTVRRDREEIVSFVMRRLIDGSEYGWISKDYVDKNGVVVKKGWYPVSGNGNVLENEERLPMFAVHYKDELCRRRFYAGFIPVASRDTFQAPAHLSPFEVAPQDIAEALEANDPLADPDMAVFEEQVASGMISLAEILQNKPDTISAAHAQEMFLFGLVDFAGFIVSNLDIDRLATLTRNPVSNREKIFYGNKTWKNVLETVMNEDIRGKIISGQYSDLTCIIPDLPENENAVKLMIKQAVSALGIYELADAPGTYPGNYYQFNGSFRTALRDALIQTGTGGQHASEPVTGMTDVPQTPKHKAGIGYVIRCIYERPRCQGIHTPVMSLPTREFQLASFFEPEAPARPIHIALPKKVGIASLRKYKKNVSVSISNSLRQKMTQLRNKTVGDLETGNIDGGNGGFCLGKICSFSIPIITICAMILLMIFVQLLNIVFFWLPFFKVCLPIKKE